MPHNHKIVVILLTEFPRRIKSTSIFTSEGDNFDNLDLSLAQSPPACVKLIDPLSQISAFAVNFIGARHLGNALHL
jgi:hypothetical protein